MDCLYTKLSGKHQKPALKHEYEMTNNKCFERMVGTLNNKTDCQQY